jgi:hypothetical protein
MITITLFTKSHGPLTKRIKLARDGTIQSDGSACRMASGHARLAKLADISELAELIEDLGSHQAIALGRPRPGLEEKLTITTKAKINRHAGPNVIARTAGDIVYRPGTQALALLDFDTKAMPGDVAGELDRLGGFWSALTSVLPALNGVARVTRESTSAGLHRTDTKEPVQGSNGVHVYVVVKDGADIERFLRALHVRCWLAGLCWLNIGASGALLERSIIDRMVGAPERLVFEGPPILEKPLRQKPRPAVAADGGTLDTLATCPPPTVAELARFAEAKAKQAHRLEAETVKVRSAFIERQAKRLAERTGMSREAARRVVNRQCEGVLLSDVVLPFDDEYFTDSTVADVLADPERFEGQTLADPVEGVEYGRCCAKIMLKNDGTPWIHSFAHGRTIYQLKLDARAVRKQMEEAATDKVVEVLVKLAVVADLDAGEIEELQTIAAKRGGVGKRVVTQLLKAAQEKKTKQQVENLRRLALAERRDPRPQIAVPCQDEPWLGVMATVNEVLAPVTAAVPPIRDIEGCCSRACRLGIPGMHAFQDANDEEIEK